MAYQEPNPLVTLEQSDRASLFSVKPIPILAARVSDEARPNWVETLWKTGRLWKDGRGYHLGSDTEQLDVGECYVIQDARGGVRLCDTELFETIFVPYETASASACVKDLGHIIAYRKERIRYVMGDIDGWGGLRWRISADPDGDGQLEFFDRHPVTQVHRYIWTQRTHVDANIVEWAMNNDVHHATAKDARGSLLEYVVSLISSIDVSVITRALVEELRSEDLIPIETGK